MENSRWKKSSQLHLSCWLVVSVTINLNWLWMHLYKWRRKKAFPNSNNSKKKQHSIITDVSYNLCFTINLFSRICLCIYTRLKFESSFSFNICMYNKELIYFLGSKLINTDGAVVRKWTSTSCWKLQHARLFNTSKIGVNKKAHMKQTRRISMKRIKKIIN